MESAYPSRTIGGHVVHYVGKVCNHAVDHVIPCERNGHCPHALRHRVLFGYTAILILIKALAITIPIALPAASLYSSAITSTNVLTLTNAARTTAGLPTLGMNAMLTQAAQAKAASMLSDQYFAHQSPDGRMPWDFIRSAGYTYRHAGENLAVHFQQAEDVHAGWMASPTHRANILDNRYTEIGVGVSSGNFEGTPAIFVVQMFGTPPNPTPTPVEEVSVFAAQPEPQPEPQPAPEPTPQPEPTPEPAPVVPVATQEPSPSPNTNPQIPAAPTIDATSASITPIPTGYRVTVAIANAQAATLAIGASVAPLDKDPAGTNTWYGVIATPTETEQSGTLTAIATGEDGLVTSTVLATFTPAEIPQDLYLFNQNERVVPKVFGVVDLGHFEDKSKRFYAYASIFMAALLLIALAFKFYKHHPTVLAHGTGVLALTILLGLI